MSAHQDPRAAAAAASDDDTDTDEFCMVSVAVQERVPEAPREPLAAPAPVPPAEAVPPAPPAAAEPPAAPVALRCTAEYSEALAQGEKLVVMADVEAEEIPAELVAARKRPSVELCAVIDRSGSMRGKKLALVLRSLEFVIREMSSTDKISIISYDQRVTRVLPLTQMTERNKQAALAQVKLIKPGGSTNLSGGLISGIREMRNAPASGERSKAVWLFTDGHANVGIKETPALLDEVHKSLGDDDRPTSIYTFGFGESHNEEMLRAVAEAGGGMYYFIEKAEDVAGCFAECLGGLMTMAAKTLNVRFEPAEGVSVERLMGEPATARGGKTYSDLFAGESRNVLFELKLAKRAEGPQCLGHAHLTYVDMKGEKHDATAQLHVERVAAYTSARMQDADVARNRLRVDALLGMRHATACADAGNFEEATRVTRELKVRVSAVTARVAGKREKTKSERQAVQLDEDLDDMMEDITPAQWHAKGKKKMVNISQSHAQQRCAQGVATSAPTGYKTQAQHSMLAKAQEM